MVQITQRTRPNIAHSDLIDVSNKVRGFRSLYPSQATFTRQASICTSRYFRDWDVFAEGAHG